jgi:hypothetical protein
MMMIIHKYFHHTSKPIWRTPPALMCSAAVSTAAGSLVRSNSPPPPPPPPTAASRRGCRPVASANALPARLAPARPQRPPPLLAA